MQKYKKVFFYELKKILILHKVFSQDFVESALRTLESAVLVLLTVCVNISKSVFKYLTPRSDVPDLFAIILMTVIFVAGLVFAVSRVNFLTMRILSSTSVIGTAYKGLGAFFGGLKFYFISAVFLVTLFKIDEHAKFLPDSAKYSRLSRGSIWFVTSIFPYLQLDKKEPRQFEYPNDSGAEFSNTYYCF